MQFKIGQIIAGRYRIDEFLGQGGMAEVYKVWDSQRAAHLAMKLLREDLSEDKVFLRRFQREAQTLSRLQHPNIVRFYRLEQDGLLAYMFMDYIQGSTLRKEIFRAKKHIPLQFILDVFRPICSALHYAHQMGVIHCDLKPGNIMIEPNKKVLVADFGIARMTDSATTTMMGAGTPAYMAPEQVRGQAPTPKTDLYALGVVLFEMLTGGERPFTGENSQSSGSTSEKVMWEQVNLKPPSLRLYRPEIPAEFDAIIARCLEKEPGKRYPDMLSLLEDIEKAVLLAPADLVSYDLEDMILLAEMETVLPDSQGTTGAESSAKPGLRKGILAWLAGGLLLLVTCSVGGIFFSGWFPGFSLLMFNNPTVTGEGQPTQEINPTLFSEAPLTLTPTHLPTTTPTRADSPTPSDSPTPVVIIITATPLPATRTPTPLSRPSLYIDDDYYCRQSASTSSEKHTMVEPGEVLIILGKSSNGWWLVGIDNPKTRTRCCWVGGGEPRGDLSIVPIISYEIDRFNCPSPP